jgi:CBS-domain-containing membrane protein
VMSSQAIVSDGDTNAGTVADRDYPTVTPDQGLDVALDVMVSAGYAWLPVVEGRNVVGIVAMNEIITGYQRALRRSLRLLAGANGSSVLVEAPVAETSVFVGTTVATAPWPTGSFVLSIDRHSQLIPPRPETELHPGDIVAAVVRADGEAELRNRLDGQPTT